MPHSHNSGSPREGPEDADNKEQGCIYRKGYRAKNPTEMEQKGKKIKKSTVHLGEGRFPRGSQACASVSLRMPTPHRHTPPISEGRAVRPQSHAHVRTCWVSTTPFEEDAALHFSVIQTKGSRHFLSRTHVPPSGEAPSKGRRRRKAFTLVTSMFISGTVVCSGSTSSVISTGGPARLSTSTKQICRKVKGLTASQLGLLISLILMFSDSRISATHSLNKAFLSMCPMQGVPTGTNQPSTCMGTADKPKPFLWLTST